MTTLFDKTELGYTATAGNLGSLIPDEDAIDFDKWGNPERAKINSALEIANLYQWRRRGCF